MDLPGLRSTPTQKRAVETVESLLDAAADLIEESGAAALSATAVAESAGTSIGRFYYWFEDTDSIIEALAERYRHHVSHAFASVRDPGAEVTTPELLGVILRHLADPEQLPTAALELLAHGLDHPEGPAAGLLPAVLDPVLALLSIRTPDTADAERAGVAQALLRTSLVWLRWSRRPDAPTDAVLDELAYMLAAYLYARYPHRDDPVWQGGSMSPLAPSSRPREHRTGGPINPATWPDRMS